MVFRACKEDKDGQKFYLDYLRNWLKDQEYVALAYMTGILPVKKYGMHSALNMFREFSIIMPMELAPYTGFTEEEVKEQCVKFGRNFTKIKEWYDGYDISDVILPDQDYEIQKTEGRELEAKHYSIYSPLSAVEAISTGIIQNYWNKTESYEAPAEYIRMNLDGLKNSVAILMDGGRVKVNISKYQNDMTSFNGSNDVLVMLQELDSGKGYADLVCLPSPKCPDKPALLIELKYNKSADIAADQIRNKEYMQKLEHYKGNILVVSVNYDKDAGAGSSDYKHHTCRIEKA